MANREGPNLGIILTSVFLLGGCVSGSHDVSHLFHNKADYAVISRPVATPVNTGISSAPNPAVMPEADGQAIIAAYRASRKVSSGKCSLGDRFDNSAELAYDFSDGKSRLALDLDIGGLGWGDLGNIEVSEVMVRYRYRFQKGLKPEERCRYISPVQGLIGSIYNEVIQREDDTVWEELDDRGLFFWRD